MEEKVKGKEEESQRRKEFPAIETQPAEDKWETGRERQKVGVEAIVYQRL